MPCGIRGLCVAVGGRAGLGCVAAAEDSRSLWSASFGCAMPQHHPGVTEVEQRGDSLGHLVGAARSAGIPCCVMCFLSELEELVGEQSTSSAEESDLTLAAIAAASAWMCDQLLTIGQTLHRS